MTDWIREQLWFLLSILGGVVVSIITTETHSVKIGAARLFSGVFCAVIFTDPIMDLWDFNPDIYENAVAGLLAITGYAVAKIIASLKLQDLMNFVKIFRGGKG